MLPLILPRLDRPLRVLAVGAHADDIEIGAGGTLAHWCSDDRGVQADVLILTGDALRQAEAKRSARVLFRRAVGLQVHCLGFTDGYLPAQWQQAKQAFEALKPVLTPDVVFCPRRDDRHQDHRVAAELVWNTWRNSLVLAYEIPKYEGDLGQPQLYQPLSVVQMRRKCQHLDRHFGSQRSHDWFSEETFRGLARLRGIECRAPGGFAEAFHLEKAVLG